MIVSAGKTEQLPFAQPIGVGLVESAMHLSRLVLFDRPDFLLFVGSMGSYGAYGLFDIIHSRRASQIELAFLDRRAYTPIDNLITSEGLEIADETIVNSSNYITSDKSVWPKFKALGIGGENMEFFSVLSVAKEHNIPAGGIFIVTNQCGANAHEEYMQNYKEAMERLQRYIKEKLKI